MIADFWLGALVVSTLGLGLLVTVGLVFLGWLVRFLSRYAKLWLEQDPGGEVKVGAEVRGRADSPVRGAE